MRIASASILPTEGLAERRWASGIAPLDAALSGGLAYGRIHEIYGGEVSDAAAAAGFAVSLVMGMSPDRAVLWLRAKHPAGQTGPFQAAGLSELGGSPHGLLLGNLPNTITLLGAAADALRSSSLGAVVVEGWGRMRELDLTASRRLALAAEKSGTPLFLLRMDAMPLPSAAQTRWQVVAAPSQALAGGAPDLPTFDVELLRQKSGPSGLCWRLEWDRDRRMFREAALSGSVVSVPSSGQAATPAAGMRSGGIEQFPRRVA